LSISVLGFRVAVLGFRVSGSGYDEIRIRLRRGSAFTFSQPPTCPLPQSRHAPCTPRGIPSTESSLLHPPESALCAAEPGGEASRKSATGFRREEARGGRAGRGARRTRQYVRRGRGDRALRREERDAAHSVQEHVNVCLSASSRRDPTFTPLSAALLL